MNIPPLAACALVSKLRYAEAPFIGDGPAASSRHSFEQMKNRFDNHHLHEDPLCCFELFHYHCFMEDKLDSPLLQSTESLRFRHCGWLSITYRLSPE